MLTQTFIFLLDAVSSFFSGALLIRFLMQLLRVPFRNPAGQFLLAVTDVAVKPLRRIVPGFLGWDWASLLSAWMVQWLLAGITFWLLGHVSGFPAALPGLAFFAGVKLLSLSINLLIWLVIIAAILSWVQPHHWLAGFAANLARPFLRPLQRIVPPIANIDLSPLILILLCQAILMLPVAWLEQAAVRLI